MNAIILSLRLSYERWNSQNSQLFQTPLQVKTTPRWKLSKYVNENAVYPSWMMDKAWSYMDVASKPLGIFVGV